MTIPESEILTDREFVLALGPLWHKGLVKAVEQSVFAWLMIGDSRMWQDEDIYEMHSTALMLLEGLRPLIARGPGR